MRETTREDYESRIVRAQFYIQRRLDEDLSLDELARIAKFSPYHFHRVFRAMVGESVKEHIRRLRMERAAGQLLHTGRQVVTIALDAGYETHESFTRAFRRRFGLPPSEFRKRGNNAALECETLTATIKKGEGDDVMDVEIKKCDAIMVASVRHTGPYAQCAKAWEALCGNEAVCRTFGPDSRFIGICYDDPDVTEEGKIRYDACVTIPAEGEFGSGVTVQTIDAGDYAVYYHKGPCEGLHDCYRQLYGQWLPQSGHEPANAPCLEIYHTDPKTTPPTEQLTEIRIPLASGA